MASKYIGSFVLAFLYATSAVSAADSTATAPTSDQIRSWIELLDHDDFQQREEASDQLVRCGDRAIAVVAEAAASSSQEVAWRAGVILQQIGVSGDERTMSKVISAMVQLEKSGKRSFKSSGTEIIERWRQHRHERAVATIRRLGGEVVSSSTQVFAGGFGFGGGFGGGFIPAEAPVIVDFGGRLAIPRGKELRLEALKDPKPALVEARREPKPVKAVRPLEFPALPKTLPDLPGFKRAMGADDVPADDAPATDLVKAAELTKPVPEETKISEPLDDKVPSKPVGIRRDEIERFAEELKKQGVEVKPLSLRIARSKPDRVKGADEAADADKADKEEDEPIELLELEDLVEEAEAPAAVVDFGAFGGDVVWRPQTTTNCLVRIGQEWKGKSSDLDVLREVTGLSTLEFNEISLDEDAIRQIARLRNLRRLQLVHSTFDREKLFALKRAAPYLSIYATGKTLLGVSGQPHPEGFHITSVVEGSAAHKAGIRIGDTITEAEGVKLTSVDELTIVIAHKNVGDPLAVTFKRDGQTQQVEAKLGPR